MAVSSDHSSPSERDGAGGGDDGIVGREGDKAAASFLSRSQTYSLLKQQMAVAAKFEVGPSVLASTSICSFNFHSLV